MNLLGSATALPNASATSKPASALPMSTLTAKAKIAIVGEAFGAEEEKLGIPFVGPAGQELNRMLREAGINRSECFVTNVFNLRPPSNDISKLCTTKPLANAAFIESRQTLVTENPDYNWPEQYNYSPLGKVGHYVHPQYLPQLARLQREIIRERPTLVVCLGNTALWALTNRTGIGKLRGFVYSSSLVDGLRVLPTYHPAAILRQWNLRPVAIADLQKAKRLVGEPAFVSEHTNTVSQGPSLWLEPTLEDIAEWWRQFGIIQSNGVLPTISIDIETARGHITTIGFGTAQGAISIPFWDKRKPGWCYWPTHQDERLALLLVRDILVSPNPKVLQNAIFDLSYLWCTWHMFPQGTIHDTMLIHHALQPEMQKDLGFLGSIYSAGNEGWKDMRKKAAVRETKRED